MTEPTSKALVKRLDAYAEVNFHEDPELSETAHKAARAIEALNAPSTAVGDEVEAALEASITLINDLLNAYVAEDMCDEARVAEARKRFTERGGTLWYIAETQSQNTKVLSHLAKSKGSGEANRAPDGYSTDDEGGQLEDLLDERDSGAVVDVTPYWCGEKHWAVVHYDEDGFADHRLFDSEDEARKFRDNASISSESVNQASPISQEGSIAPAALSEMDFDIEDDGCFMCGGSGELSDACVCEAFEDVCCCAEPEPPECPECRRRKRHASADADSRVAASPQSSESTDSPTTGESS